MTDHTERQLDREAALLAELRARRSASERQAALITGDDIDEAASGAPGVPQTASGLQAQVALYRAQRAAGTPSERQALAAQGIDPGEETERERKRRLIRAAWNRNHRR
ncbi:hypothetical protein [uncultured Microbacterium sp.]|uniref:hypothetical protein n=1 Tax=uncultured Microbacterium sp. TaxID=191216 RepID=UPI0025EC949C|nr:hypothetical protein [uncultured Microbacterium sp.]